MGYDEIEALPAGPDKAIACAVNGLLTGGGAHKQWILEKVLESLGVDLGQLRQELLGDGYDWDRGIAP